MRLEAEFTELISQPDEINQICQSAVDNWRSRFRRDIFVENLQKYMKLSQDSQNNSSELDALYKYFKDVRKAGQYLRTTYLLFDVAHDEPENFHSFVWQLGQLNDTFRYPNKSLSHASILSNLMTVSEKWGEFTIRPDTVENILSYAKHPLNRARRLVEHSELVADDFHELRKKLRLFTNIYTLAVRYGRMGKVKEMKDLLVSINDEMGAVNDRLVELDIQGVTAFEANVVPVDPELRTKIRELLLGNAPSTTE